MGGVEVGVVVFLLLLAPVCVAAICLVVMYFVIKHAVLAALREHDRERQGD